MPNNNQKPDSLKDKPSSSTQSKGIHHIQVVCRASNDAEVSQIVPVESHSSIGSAFKRACNNLFNHKRPGTVYPTAVSTAATTGERLTGRSSSSSFGLAGKGKNSIFSSSDAGTDSSATVVVKTSNGSASTAKNSAESAAVPRTSSVFDFMDHGSKQRSAIWKQRIASAMDSVPYTFVTLFFTLCAVYADLIRQACFPKSADIYFTVFTIVAISFFTLEIIVSSIVKPKYLGRFFMWMDVLATLALLCDLPGFMDAVTPGADKEGEQHTTLDRSAKATQAGARAIRLVQLFRMIKLMHGARQHKKKMKMAMLQQQMDGEDCIFEEQVADGAQHGGQFQTRVGEKVTERTMTKVILGVVLMLLVLPIFDSSVFYGTVPLLEDGGLVMLHDMYAMNGDTAAFRTAADSFVEEMEFKMGSQHTGFVYKLTVYNNTLIDDADNLRKEERLKYSVEAPACDSTPVVYTDCYISTVYVDIKWAVQMQSLLDIGRVTFLVMALALAALLFIRDTDELVLKPIERMVVQVRNVSLNPLAKQTNIGVSKSGKQMETRILEHSIAKICSLLSVGFGEAGAEIIADNMKSGGDLNPMVPGRRVMAIFGFCDIRNFTDTTEVLQEGVMEFVNSIASIVHQEVALHGGAANKNIGDAFLLVWKLPGSPGVKRNRSSIINTSGARPSIKGGSGLMPMSAAEETSRIADAALASFIIVQSALKRSTQLQKYCQRQDLNDRMPGFAIKMGFGLHVGWAIEGAIGSKFKIDASYLSPHVNMAARLEAATKQFNVPILLSDDFVNMLSPDVRRRVRQIDCVTVKGSRQPISLYTYDIDIAGVVPDPADEDDADINNNGDYTSRSSDTDNTKPNSHMTYSEQVYSNEYDQHPDILAVSNAGDAFLARFAEGFDAYKYGEWETAREILTECRTLRRDAYGRVIVDGPCDTLLSVMADKGFTAPEDWPGFRELTEK